MADSRTAKYYRDLVIKLEKDLYTSRDESDYYRQQLADAHALLGRVVHQLSGRWDSVRLTTYYPTDNLRGKRTLNNPKGK